MTKINYPEVHKDPVSEDYHGTTVSFYVLFKT